MKNLTRQNPEQLFVAQELINKVKSKCCGIKGYLKTTTIYPDEAIIGYMNIKRKKGKILIVNIPIGDYIYTFKWDVNRKK